MINVSIRDFMNQNYRKNNHSIYVVADGDAVLYIGISRGDIWERWFYSQDPHMRFLGNKPLPVGGTRIGEKIAINYPESLDWTIQLWTERDGRKYTKGKTLEEIEEIMIEKMRPLYNVSLSRWFDASPRTEKETAHERNLDLAYDAIFNK